jgi:hypothetical protein
VCSSDLPDPHESGVFDEESISFVSTVRNGQILLSGHCVLEYRSLSAATSVAYGDCDALPVFTVPLPGTIVKGVDLI